MKNRNLIDAAEAYLAYRRKLGFALVVEGAQLCRFASYADNTGLRGPITTNLALQWAKLPQNCNPIYMARRLDIVRRFARYMKLIDPETEIPPERILGSSYRRPMPHIYPKEEIASLMMAARNLTPIDGLRPWTYVTLFGLLACSGMRISEALSLSSEDVDFLSGTITIIESKYHKSRILPLHSTTLEALRFYLDKRDKKHPIPKARPFLLVNAVCLLSIIR